MIRATRSAGAKDGYKATFRKEEGRAARLRRDLWRGRPNASPSHQPCGGEHQHDRASQRPNRHVHVEELRALALLVAARHVPVLYPVIAPSAPDVVGSTARRPTILTREDGAHRLAGRLRRRARQHERQDEREDQKARGNERSCHPRQREDIRQQPVLSPRRLTGRVTLARRSREWVDPTSRLAAASTAWTSSALRRTVRAHCDGGGAGNRPVLHGVQRAGRSAVGPMSERWPKAQAVGRGGGAGNRTLVREASIATSFTCVVAVSPATGFADSAATYLSQSQPRYREHPRATQP